MNETTRDKNEQRRMAYAEAEIARNIRRIRETEMSIYLCQVEELTQKIGRRGFIGGCKM